MIQTKEEVGQGTLICRLGVITHLSVGYGLSHSSIDKGLSHSYL